MRPRYLLLVSDDRNRIEALGARAADQGLRIALEWANALLLLSPGSPAIDLGPDRGIVVGTVFERGRTPLALSGFAPDVADQVVASAGRSLLADHWGGYLAVTRHETDVTVLRDPSGVIPAYHGGDRDAWVVSSDVTLLRFAGVRTGLDRQGLAEHLIYTDLRTARTCLTNVHELIRGNALIFRPDHGIAIERAWSPHPFALASPLTGEAAIEAVRASTLSSVAGWASCFDRIQLGLSGGLDSSIVAAGLATANADFHCVTMATTAAEGDEREYARMVSAALGVDLVEAFPDAAAIDVTCSAAASLPRPVARAFAQEDDRISIGTADARGTDAFFNGGGGDNVFCLLTSGSPIADALLAHRPRAALGALRDMAALTGSGYAVAARYGYRAWRRFGRPPVWRPDCRYVSPNALGLAHLQPVHPWLVDASSLPPGKLAHLMMLIRIQNHLEGYAREHRAPVVSPLLAQPVVETCLSIPSWAWCGGGRDRVIARRAFEGMLPRAILERRSKGALDGLAGQVFERHRETMRTLLLDGVLASLGLIDVGAVAQGLSVPAAIDQNFVRLLTLCDVEAWARLW